ncbi:hypothetical protein JCM24511_07220 [Saitozyma sp. JCM 24511]|nr:hypothetical protein JCM24511_07220 [Saitozyma sp. JCM 24511]
MSTAIVFGANGISGTALLGQLVLSSPKQWKRIIAVSRRPPVLEHSDVRVVFKSIDLLGDVQGIAKDLHEAGGAEAAHVFFYAYLAKDNEDELVAVNRRLFANTLDAVARACPKLETFSLQTGYKYYGAHLGGSDLSEYPWTEDTPRIQKSNFYYLQEDMLSEAAKKNGWRWIVTRPGFIVGLSKGNFMSLAVTIALYATARKALGQPLVYPGSSFSLNLPNDHSSAFNNADFQIFAALNEETGSGVYNIHDGDQLSFAELWPKFAEYFDMAVCSLVADEASPGFQEKIDVLTLHPSVDWTRANEAKLHAFAKDAGIDENSFKYATWDFLDMATSRTWPDQASMASARSIGWDRTIDSWEKGYKQVFDKLRQLGIIPAPDT